MKEFIKKLTGRLEEEKKYCSYHPHTRDEAINKAISIANELAEEHNGGWIPCSKRLPKDEELSQRKEVIVQNRYGEIFTAEYTYNSTHTHKDFFKNHHIVPYVTAWQPLPGKYIPKGEQ